MFETPPFGKSSAVSRTTTARPRQADAKLPPRESAQRAGLRYTTDHGRGITREGGPKSFRYTDVAGKPVRDDATLARIRAHAIPPAWRDVWICPHANGHLQVTGRDAKGRKQSRYHADFRAERESSKYERVIAFAQALPKLRATVRRHLRLPGLQRKKVLATVVALLEKTLIRIGNDRYAKDNEHFGLTTMRDGHVKVVGSRVEFNFTGKSGVDHEMVLRDKKLARIVKACQDLPEQELFAYVDDRGKHHDVKSNDVNAYLREATGMDFTAKDFRTWAGTVLASQALAEFERFDTDAQAKKNVVRAIETVAKKLGNTRAVCRKCYVHPAILNSYMDGSLAKSLQGKAERALADVGKLRPEEAAVVALIRDQMKAKAKTAA